MPVLVSLTAVHVPCPFKRTRKGGRKIIMCNVNTYTVAIRVGLGVLSLKGMVKNRKLISGNNLSE